MGKGEQTRRGIVRRALAIAGDVGLENVTLGTLATDLGMSKSGLFAHFKSKEALQLAVLEEAVERFGNVVARAALSEPRGEPRFVALFERWLAWILDRGTHPEFIADTQSVAAGRCIFMALSQEYDDRPGPVRDAVVKSQRDWREFIAGAALLAVKEGHFVPDLDVEQVAFEFVAIGMAYQQTHNLLGDPDAERRARTALAALLERCRVKPMRPR